MLAGASQCGRIGCKALRAVAPALLPSHVVRQRARGVAAAAPEHATPRRGPAAVAASGISGVDHQGAQAVQAVEVEGEAQAEQVPMPSEAEAEAGSRQQAETVTEEEEVEVVQLVEPLTFKSAVSRSQAFLTTTWPGKLLVGAVAAAALGTLGLAAHRVWQRANTPRAKRMQQLSRYRRKAGFTVSVLHQTPQIDRNRDLVEGLSAFLPARRAALTPGELRRLQRSSGFTPVEVFRKYLWYVLRERKFDQGAVDDLVHLKVGLGLSDADVGEALRERSTRVYDKYGTLMLNAEGLTLSGAQRKATCSALFRKVLYLAECEALVGAAASEPGGSGHVADIGKIFGATLEDMERLRIRNLYEAELDLEGLVADSDEGEGPQAQGGQAGQGGAEAGRKA